jgi:hypothetical protein
MSLQTQPFTDPCDAPEDQARPLIDDQLLLLGRLAEVGLNIALAVERQATGKLEIGEAPVAADVSLAYARVSRAVRMTIALQSKLIAEQRALEADEPPPQTPLYIRKARVERIVERVIKAEHEGADAEALEETLDRLVIEAGERLDDEDVYGDVLTRPMSEVLAQICKDLGLSPDWPSLAQEPWAQAEISSGEAGWPLAQSREPFPPRGGGSSNPKPHPGSHLPPLRGEVVRSPPPPPPPHTSPPRRPRRTPAAPAA